MSSCDQPAARNHSLVRCRPRASASARLAAIAGGSAFATWAASAASINARSAATTKVACRLRAHEAIPHTTLDRRTGRGRYVTKAATLAGATDRSNRQPTPKCVNFANKRPFQGG